MRILIFLALLIVGCSHTPKSKNSAVFDKAEQEHQFCKKEVARVKSINTAKKDQLYDKCMEQFGWRVINRYELDVN